MVTKIITAEISCVINAALAKRSHDLFSIRSVFLPAVKKAMVEIMDATNARSTKKCPTWPGNKCSPSNCIVIN
jgi:hypothetical protein